ncbi:alpha/beta hydrolase [Pseudaestuariivita sp.]|uniref:alpha/beta hydrolase n=1 Tax=Pseudaestuariivita sp. TaxID=2211669 RepID=UPI00405A21BA
MLPDDPSALDAYFATDEARFPDIRHPECAKRIVWAGAPGAVTDLSIVYLHGFSATSQEIQPVPTEVAKALGANLFLTRLTGHGRDGDAMADGSVAAWTRDTGEALETACRIGRRVIVMATSTGATLATLAACDPARVRDVAGMVFVSPNFGIRNPMARILTWPGVRRWGPYLFGETRTFEPRAPLHGTYWTTSYPSLAVVPVAELVRDVWRSDLGRARVPLLVFQSRHDEVVSAAKTEAAVARWGGSRTLDWVTLDPGDDPGAHCITGDILSPNQTPKTIARVVEWLGETVL